MNAQEDLWDSLPTAPEDNICKLFRRLLSSTTKRFSFMLGYLLNPDRVTKPYAPRQPRTTVLDHVSTEVLPTA